MKKIKLLLIITSYLFGSISIAKAQQTTNYYLCPTLQQYEGEYKYVNGQDETKIYLRYHREIRMGAEFGLNYDAIQDVLIGWICYTSGGTIIDSNYQNRYMFLPYIANNIFRDSYSFFLTYDYKTGCGSPILQGAIRDFGHSSQTKNVVVNVSNNGQTFDWSQYHQIGYGAFNGDYGMTLPANFVLNKQ